MDKFCSVLLVEDDDVDALNVKRAFKKNDIQRPLIRAHDGIEALAILRETAWGPENPCPNIVLLDMNMPKMNGLEFLQHLREDTLLRNISVFMLTTSSDQRDLNESYKLKVAGYFLKPFDFSRFVQAVKILDAFWTLCERPIIHNVKHPPHILLVDDDDVIRMVISKVLENSGYTVCNASNGIEALKRLEGIQPDLIITDLNMPNMDGWELVEKLRKNTQYQNTPIILLSGDCDVSVREKAQQNGIDLVLPKDMGATIIKVHAKKILHRR